MWTVVGSNTKLTKLRDLNSLFLRFQSPNYLNAIMQYGTANSRSSQDKPGRVKKEITLAGLSESAELVACRMPRESDVKKRAKVREGNSLTSAGGGVLGMSFGERHVHSLYSPIEQEACHSRTRLCGL